MKKISIWLFLIVILSTVVFADFGMMGDYNMMSAGWFGWGFLWLVWFAIGAFIFSVIFWLTHNWLVKKKR